MKHALTISSDDSYAINILWEDYDDGLISRRKVANEIGDVIANLVMSQEPIQFVLVDNKEVQDEKI